jgi:hypothetical protein
MNSASLCSLAGRYDNPIPLWFPAPIDFLKIPAPFILSLLSRESFPLYSKNISCISDILKCKTIKIVGTKPSFGKNLDFWNLKNN